MFVGSSEPCEIDNWIGTGDNMMVNLNALNKAIVEAMKVIAPEEVKCLNKMVKDRTAIHDRMVKEDVLGEFGTSSFKEVLKVVDHRIEEWYVKAREAVTECLVNRYEEGDVVSHNEFEYEWITTTDGERTLLKDYANDGDVEEEEEEEEEEFEYEWITTLPEPKPNRFSNSNTDDCDHDENNYLDCDVPW